MRILQLILLAAFAVFAALTVLLQMRYGSLVGRAEQTENRQNDPKALACRRKAMLCAVTAAVLLVACMAVGALSMQN